MKTIRTRLGFEAVTLGEGDERVTIGRTPLTVADAKAAEYQKAAESVGVDVVVADVDDEAGNPVPTTIASPDLSAGTSAVTGQGDPVESPDTTTDGGDKPARTTKKAGN